MKICKNVGVLYYCAAAFNMRSVVFQLQIVKNFQSAHRTETIYIHKSAI